MSNRQLTMTPALPSAPGRPREPGLPYKKENETKENWRKSLNHIRQSLLKHDIMQEVWISLRGKYEHKPSQKTSLEPQKNAWRRHSAKVGQHYFQTNFITYQNLSLQFNKADGKQMLFSSRKCTQ